MYYRDFDTFKHHEVLLGILKLGVPVLILKVAPDSLLRFLHPGIVAFRRVSLFLCILKRGISNFENGFNLNTAVWVFIDAGELLIASSLDGDELFILGVKRNGGDTSLPPVLSCLRTSLGISFTAAP